VARISFQGPAKTTYPRPAESEEPGQRSSRGRSKEAGKRHSQSKNVAQMHFAPVRGNSLLAGTLAHWLKASSFFNSLPASLFGPVL